MPIKNDLTSVLIASFSPWKNSKRGATNGMIEPMISFFTPRVEHVVLIDEPYPGSDRIIPHVESYQNGKQKKTKTLYLSSILLYPLLYLQNGPGTQWSFKLRDFFSVVECGVRGLKKYDVFIGLESINTIAGLVLKKLGIVKTVVYYVSDYSPKRYSSKIFNDLYLWLDRFCSTHADYIWDVSKAIADARIKTGLSAKRMRPVIHVPNALFKEQIINYPPEKRTPFTATFIGTLGEENGPGLAIDAWSIIVRKIPKAKLHIIGGGRELDELRRRAINLGIERNVKFWGFIPDARKISNIAKRFQLALAPYRFVDGSPRLYGDATKIRLYLGVGLPVITTAVPPLGKEIAEKKAAVIVDDSAKSLTKAILDLFENKEKYENMAKAALKYAKKNTWINTYSDAIHKMGFQINKTKK